MLDKPKDLYLSSFKGVNRFLINEIIKYKQPFPYIDGLRLSIILGFVSAFLGFVFAIISLFEKMINPDIPTGYSAIIITVTFFSGIILISIGVIGEYLGRLFIAQTSKPQYIIRKKIKKK